MTEQQRSNISNLGKSCQQAEDALSQGMDKLQQMVLESVAAGQLEEQTNTPNMSTAMERLAVLKVLEADKCLEVVFEIPLLYTEIGLFVDPPSVFMSNNTWSLLLPEGFQIENLKLGNITFASRDKIFLKGRDTSELAVVYSSYLSKRLSRYRGSNNIGALIMEPGKNFMSLHNLKSSF
ncbi:hypothetical protein AHAS_Ahas11G0163800 [Arachis hypogaea]